MTAPDSRPFPYRETTLANGLRVITLEDHSAPVAAVQLWYRVGSADETHDRHGFAHMFDGDHRTSILLGLGHADGETVGQIGISFEF